MLCAVLAFVGSWAQASFAEHLVPIGNTLVQDSTAAAASPAPTGAAAVATAATDTPADEPASRLMADPAGDLPELLLTTAAAAVLAVLVYRQAAFKLRRLPHPFVKRPQRPPQVTAVTTQI